MILHRRGPGRLALLPVLALAAACSSSPSPDGRSDPASVPTGVAVAGKVKLIGTDDASGTVVSIVGGPSVTADAAGDYAFASAPTGPQTLLVKRGDWEEVVPGFVVAEGAGPQVRDGGTLHPLPVLEVPRAHRVLASAADLGAWYTAPTGALLHISRAGDPLDGLGDLHLTGPADASSRIASPGVAWTGDQFRLSPDGALVASAPRECIWGAEGSLIAGSPLEVAPVAGGATVRLAEEIGCRFGFTPGGARIIYQLDQSVHAPLRSVLAAGGSPVDLGEGILVDADDERALVIRGTPVSGGVGPGELWSVSLADGAGVLLAGGVHRARFVLGGAQVLHWVGTSTFLVPRQGGVARELGTTGLTALRFTAGGERVVWIRHNGPETPNDVLIADVAGGAAVPLGTSTGMYLELSPDGTEAIVLGARQSADGGIRSIEAIRLADGASRIITALAGITTFTLEPWSDPWPSFAREVQPHQVAFGAAGTTMFFHGWDDASRSRLGLQRVPVAGGPQERIGEAGEFRLTPAGDRVIYFSELPSLEWGTLASAPAAGGPATILAQHAWEQSLQLSPDGAHVAFTAFEPPDDGWCSTLHVAPTDGGPARPVLRNVGAQIWAGDSTLYAAACGNAAPLSWRDGVYRVTVR